MTSPKRWIGRKIAAQRRLAGFSQAQLAEKIGVATETISRLETGSALPSVARLAAIAAVLEIGLDELFRQRPLDLPEDEAIERLVRLMSRRTASEIDLVASVATSIFQHITKERLVG